MQQEHLSINRPESQSASQSLCVTEESMWGVANTLAVMTATCASVILVHSPLTTLQSCFMKNEALYLDASVAGMLVLARRLYLGSNVSGSAARTVYVTNTKKTHASSELNESMLETGAIESDCLSADLKQRQHPNSGVKIVAISSLGETVFTQVSDTKSQLLKYQTILKDFRVIRPLFFEETEKRRIAWHNLRVLATSGLFSRCLTATMNFSALCMLEGVYADQLQLSNPTMNHFAAGALSGMTSAVLSHPLSYFRNYRLFTIKNEHGRLLMPSLGDFAAQVKQRFSQQGVVSTCQQVARASLPQLTLSVARTSATFSTVIGVVAALGPEPLAPVRQRVNQWPAYSSCMGFFALRPAPESPELSDEERAGEINCIVLS